MLDPAMNDQLIQNIRQVRARVAAAAERSGRSPEAVTIVGVSKTVGIEAIQTAYSFGLKEFGENRVQEAREKISAFRPPLIRWRLIGHLQSNKSARAAEIFDVIESVDSLKLASALNQHAAAHDKHLRILIQINIAAETGKSGLALADLAEIASIIQLPQLKVEGLMTIAPYTDQPEEVRPVFRRLRELRDSLRQEYPQSEWRHLSMGMTADFEIAIAEGATIVRIGRAIFGERLG